MEKTLKQECIELIKMIYRHHAAGGDLHIVLDDDNVEDDFIVMCIQRINRIAEGDTNNAWFYLVELACATLLVQMTNGEKRCCIRKAKEV